MGSVAQREVDYLVAEHIMKLAVERSNYHDGWNYSYPTDNGRMVLAVPPYTTDRNACAAAEQVIVERGLGDKYAWVMLSNKSRSDFEQGDHEWLLTADPDTRCRAMLRAVGVEV